MCVAFDGFGLGVDFNGFARIRDAWDGVAAEGSKRGFATPLQELVLAREYKPFRNLF